MDSHPELTKQLRLEQENARLRARLREAEEVIDQMAAHLGIAIGNCGEARRAIDTYYSNTPISPVGAQLAS